MSNLVRLTIAPPAPVQSRMIADIRVTPEEAWEAFIGPDISVSDFFDIHRGYTLRGYINELLATLPEADRNAAADLVITYARSSS